MALSVQRNLGPKRNLCIYHKEQIRSLIDWLNVLRRFQKYFRHITATAHVINVFPAGRERKENDTQKKWKGTVTSEMIKKSVTNEVRKKFSKEI